MHEDYDEMLDLMDRTFHNLEHMLPNKPKLTQLSFGYAFRFEHKTIYEAMIQKLARVQSALRAARLLNIHGFIQEQAAIHRIIDETNEDLVFLGYAVILDDITDLHGKYLEAFWQEEVDETGRMYSSTQKRPMIPRKKIHAYLARVDGLGNPSRSVELSRTLSKAYSGYIHGASPHIMDMYGGNPPSFHTKGMSGTLKVIEYSEDLWNYMYRTFLSHIFVAKAFGAEKHVETLMHHKHKFEENGWNYF